MDYRLKIGDDEPVLVGVEDILESKVNGSLNRNEGGTMSLVLGDRNFNVSFLNISENMIHIEIDGVAHRAYIAVDGGEKHIMIDGAEYLVQDADLSERRVGRSGGRAVPTEVTPPMPSVVVRVLVNVGDVVENGDGVVVVSSMKMETTLYAPFSGTVTKINVSDGDKVDPGQILVDIEKNIENDGGDDVKEEE